METVVRTNHHALVGKSGNGVVVATVDSGVANGHPHVGTVAGGVAIQPDGSLTPDFADRLGHGTAVVAAIREKAPNTTILAVRVFHTELSTGVDSLLRAIDWAAEHGAHLINLSLGTPDPSHAEQLATAVARASRKGALVVSASQHRGRPWWPGSLPNVVPVVLDHSCERMAIIAKQDNGLNYFAASGCPRPIPNVPPERNLQGISFAVANVTGMLARLIEGWPSPRLASELHTHLLHGPPPQ